MGTYVKFVAPMISGGMVYVGTANQLVAYGLLVGPPQVAAPIFSPGGGTYASAQNVTISDATSGASIRYTLDGSTPSGTAGTLYSGPVNISNTATLQAIAFLSGDLNSPVTSGTYTINPPLAASGGGGGAPSYWFLGLLAFAGLLLWKLRKRTRHFKRRPLF
jgi:MYXO-CTERM domain-containing protein